MVLPSLALLTVFVLCPIVYSLALSLFNSNLLTNETTFAGVDNYVQMFGDDRFWNALANTLLFSLAYVPALLILALVLALGLNTTAPGHKAFQMIYFLPALTSLAIVAIVWRFLLDGDIGMISLWLKSLGMKVTDPLRDTGTAMATVVSVSVWRWAGFNMIILLAGLKAIPAEMYEAASMDGAGVVRKFFSVTLPLLLPNLSFVFLTNLIASFQVFDQVYVMTKGGPLFATETLVYYTYYNAFNLFEMGYASAMALFLFLIILIFTVFQLRMYTQAEKDRGFA
jgi:multiple sugar transport system permease protein